MLGALDALQASNPMAGAVARTWGSEGVGRVRVVWTPYVKTIEVRMVPHRSRRNPEAHEANATPWTYWEPAYNGLARTDGGEQGVASTVFISRRSEDWLLLGGAVLDDASLISLVNDTPPWPTVKTTQIDTSDPVPFGTNYPMVGGVAFMEDPFTGGDSLTAGTQGRYGQFTLGPAAWVWPMGDGTHRHYRVTGAIGYVAGGGTPPVSPIVQGSVDQQHPVGDTTPAGVSWLEPFRIDQSKKTQENTTDDDVYLHQMALPALARHWTLTLDVISYPITPRGINKSKPENTRITVSVDAPAPIDTSYERESVQGPMGIVFYDISNGAHSLQFFPADQVRSGLTAICGALSLKAIYHDRVEFDVINQLGAVVSTTEKTSYQHHALYRAGTVTITTDLVATATPNNSLGSIFAPLASQVPALTRNERTRMLLNRTDGGLTRQEVKDSAGSITFDETTTPFGDCGVTCDWTFRVTLDQTRNSWPTPDAYGNLPDKVHFDVYETREFVATVTVNAFGYTHQIPITGRFEIDSNAEIIFANNVKVREPSEAYLEISGGRFYFSDVSRNPSLPFDPPVDFVLIPHPSQPFQACGYYDRGRYVVTIVPTCYVYRHQGDTEVNLFQETYVATPAGGFHRLDKGVDGILPSPTVFVRAESQTAISYVATNPITKQDAIVRPGDTYAGSVFTFIHVDNPTHRSQTRRLAPGVIGPIRTPNNRTQGDLYHG